jgi:non-ribosomal peptide synthase protein (TIGR01720 family)
VPSRGIGYGLLRYLRNDADHRARFESLPHAEVRFNYLGQFDQLFGRAALLRGVGREPTGPTQSPHALRPYLLSINGIVMDAQLRIDWSYSDRLHRHDTIAAVAQQFLAALRGLIGHCQAPHAGGFTPSDFPRARLTQHALDHFLSKISHAG